MFFRCIKNYSSYIFVARDAFQNNAYSVNMQGLSDSAHLDFNCEGRKSDSHNCP